MTFHRIFLEEAKKIGKEALKALPSVTTPDGKSLGMPTCIRTDIGCSDSPVNDKDYAHWNTNSRTYFLNEIEYGGTTYFARALKFDCIPLWAQLYATKAQEIYDKINEGKKEEHEATLKDFTLAAVSTCDSLDSCASTNKDDTSSDSDQESCKR